MIHARNEVENVGGNTLGPVATIVKEQRDREYGMYGIAPDLVAGQHAGRHSRLTGEA